MRFVSVFSLFYAFFLSLFFRVFFGVAWLHPAEAGSEQEQGDAGSDSGMPNGSAPKTLPRIPQSIL